jgi:sulfite reductase (NADPH) hemoprotein beta-component
MIEPAAPVKLTHNEILKDANPTLAGTIASTLVKNDVDRFSEDDSQFMKFHGIYQQDDRDKRKTAKQYMFMVRGRLPGGFVSANQYLIFDDLATKYGNQTLRITTRQGFQFHGVVKSGLGKLIKGINEALATTLAACGDVTRNVMSPATPCTSPLVDRILEDARRLSKALLPQTKAYHQIWVDGVELDLNENDFVDPLYGKKYLPRKFKVAFAIPPSNDIDIFTNCLGFVAIAEGNKLVGYNMLAGGGMGMTHGNKETYPRLADVVGFFAPEHIETMAKAVLTTYRDYGDRTNRKHARLKYVLEDKGVDWFRNEVEQRTGIKFERAREFNFTTQSDPYGWHKQFNGKNFFCLFVENGRIKDDARARVKSGIRKVVEEFQPEVRLTASQNLIFSDVEDSKVDAITRLLNEHGIATDNQASAVRLASLACPALPTCGLALSESERVLPDIITRLEGLLTELGLQDDEITVRMTGCPNGCARPYMAEIAFVGRAPNKYMIYLGGNENSTRLNRIFKENIKGEDLLNELRPLLTRYVQERVRGERFGNWCERVLWQESATAAPVPQVAAVSI